MMHVEEGVLQAYLDAEVTAGVRAEIDKHLQSCSACNAELHRLRTASLLFSNAVRHSDVVAPVLAAQVRLGAAQKLESKVAIPAPRPRRAFARAAMFIVGLAAVASAAVPGSPVRAWISTALTRAGLLDDPQSSAGPVVRDEAPAVERGTSAPTVFFIEPVAGSVRVVLTNVKPGVVVSVQAGDAPRVEVEVVGAAARAHFESTSGRLAISGVEGGSVLVRVPRSGPTAIVEQDGRIIYKSGR
jgi:anti-sigma factor RsiW